MKPYNAHYSALRHGFTLIELSIVLVIIGLIVGGILTGRELISSSYVRAQISQIDRFQAAKNTFRVKYNYLPGDIMEPAASSFGFIARGAYAGMGDGNGILEAVECATTSCNTGVNNIAGELPVFWRDLSDARLIDGYFATAPISISSARVVTGTALRNYLPAAKIGSANSVYAWSAFGVNWFGMMNISHMETTGSGTGAQYYATNKGFTVAQAHALDSKIDDGLPHRGTVLAAMVSAAGVIWSTVGISGPPTPSSVALAGSATTCMDNNNTFGTNYVYSLQVNNGNYSNCAISIRFQ